MRVQSVLALMAASVAYAAPIADADYAPQPYEKPTPKPYEAPKPTYGGAELPNPFEVIGDAAVALIKWKLALIKEGAKIILSPFEAAYAAAHDLQPEYPAPGKTYYARDADYAPKGDLPNPFEIIGDAALDLLKYKLYLIKQGAKIILSPFEQSYVDKYHPAPAYPPAGKTYYARDADKYEPKPTYGGEELPNPFEIIGEAALDLLKYKLYLIKQGAKIILSPFEQSYVDKYHPEPAYPAPKKSYPRGEYEPKKGDVGEELSEAAIEVLKWKLWLIKAGFKIILTPAEIIYDGLHHPEPTAPPKGYYA